MEFADSAAQEDVPLVRHDIRSTLPFMEKDHFTRLKTQGLALLEVCFEQQGVHQSTDIPLRNSSKVPHNAIETSGLAS
eukprot:7775851-Pyramimonas_sp.AAC.1